MSNQPEYMEAEHSQDFYRELGERIRQARHEIDLGVEEMADIFGMKRSWVGGVERGEIPLPPYKLVKLMEVLGVSADYLLGGGPLESHAETSAEKVVETIRQTLARFFMEDVEFRQLILAQKLQDALKDIETKIKVGGL